MVLASYGPVLQNVVFAAELLERRGLDVGIVNFHTLKPLDGGMVETLATEYSHIVSVDEHSVFGGLGTAIGECLAEYASPGPKAILHRVGIQDKFGESGSADELLAKHGMDPEGLASYVLGLI